MSVDKAKIAALCAETKARREAARGGFGVLPAGDGGEDGGGDPRRLTRWIADAAKEPSRHAGGRKMRGGAWLQAECAAQRARGRQVRVAGHPKLKGYAALFLE